jgi:hypothetical protein
MSGFWMQLVFLQRDGSGEPIGTSVESGTTLEQVLRQMNWTTIARYSMNQTLHGKLYNVKLDLNFRFTCDRPHWVQVVYIG